MSLQWNKILDCGLLLLIKPPLLKSYRDRGYFIVVVLLILDVFILIACHCDSNIETVFLSKICVRSSHIALSIEFLLALDYEPIDRVNSHQGY